MCDAALRAATRHGTLGVHHATATGRRCIDGCIPTDVSLIVIVAVIVLVCAGGYRRRLEGTRKRRGGHHNGFHGPRISGKTTGGHCYHHQQHDNNSINCCRCAGSGHDGVLHGIAVAVQPFRAGCNIGGSRDEDDKCRRGAVAIARRRVEREFRRGEA